MTIEKVSRYTLLYTSSFFATLPLSLSVLSHTLGYYHSTMLIWMNIWNSSVLVFEPRQRIFYENMENECDWEVVCMCVTHACKHLKSQQFKRYQSSIWYCQRIREWEKFGDISLPAGVCKQWQKVGKGKFMPK